MFKIHVKPDAVGLIVMTETVRIAIACKLPLSLKNTKILRSKNR